MKKVKKILIGVVLFIILVQLANMAGLISIKFDSDEFKDAVSNKTDAQTKPKEATEFQKTTDTTPEQEAEILAILESCGIKNIQSIAADELLDDMNMQGEKGFRIKANGISNIILYLKPDKTVNIIRYADNNLYSDGTINSKLSDYTFTLDEQTKLQTSCEQAVKSLLKSPSTAKFPHIGEWKFGKKDGEILVQSYVDSQNSFGAELRSEFQFILSNDYSIKSFIFDGQEYIKNKK